MGLLSGVKNYLTRKKRKEKGMSLPHGGKTNERRLRVMGNKLMRSLKDQGFLRDLLKKIYKSWGGLKMLE